MAIEVKSSSPPMLPQDVNSEPILSYSRHYAKKIHDLGKSSRETWIQTLVEHMLHGTHPSKTHQNNSGYMRRTRANKGEILERVYENIDYSPNMPHRRKHHHGLGFDLAGATTRRNGRIMNSLMDSPYLPKTKILQENPVYLRRIVQNREGYRELHHRGSRDNLSTAAAVSSSEKDAKDAKDTKDGKDAKDGKDEDKHSSRSSYKAHNYPPIKNTNFKEGKAKISIPVELAASPYVSNRQNVHIVPTEKVLAPSRTRPRPTTQNAGGRSRLDGAGGPNGAPGVAHPRTTNPYLQSTSAPAHMSNTPEAWRPPLPPTVQTIALEKRARALASKAIKENKIFTCEGPYPLDAYVRFSMRKRGWVEKFAPRIYNIISTGKATSSKLECQLDEDFDVICDRNVPAPWEEDYGVYAMMSRLVRHRPARFIWAGRAVNSMILHQDVIVNHFPKAHHFASKTGIASSLRDLPWLASSDPMEFFPRCYLLSEDERDDFVEDFRICACISLLKWVIFIFTQPVNEHQQKVISERSKTIEVIHEDEPATPSSHPPTHPSTDESEDKEPGHSDLICKLSEVATEMPPPSDSALKESVHVYDLANNNVDLAEDDDTHDYAGARDPDFVSSASSSANDNDDDDNDDCGDDDDDDDDDHDDNNGDVVDKVSLPLNGKEEANKRVRPVITVREKPGGVVPAKAVDWALNQCERYIRFKTHDDIDQRNKAYLTNMQWEQFLEWYYKVAHDGAVVSVTESKLRKVKMVLSKMRRLWKQYDIDGMRNMWIVKPGGRSKGIGIEFCTKLSDILKYISNNTLTGTYVVQKYIETPCLLYKTKFDIRQWFVVTDWNPLTVWFYKGSYLRICSQEYTLDSLHEAVHLSNVAIQQFYLNGDREGDLPDDNYMSSEQFEEYLASVGAGNVWEEMVYPGMIQAVVNTLLATSDIAENKKAAFELYGADFMLSDNYTPWLLEVNSSPGMAPTTKEKAKMCATVIEDLMKVVLDKRENKNCETGNFELVFKDQPMPTFKAVDNRIFIEGSRIRRSELMRYSCLDSAIYSGQDPTKTDLIKQLRVKQIRNQLREAVTVKTARDRDEMKLRALMKLEGFQSLPHPPQVNAESSLRDQELVRSYGQLGGYPKQWKASPTKPRRLIRGYKKRIAHGGKGRLGKNAKKKEAGGAGAAASPRAVKPARTDRIEVDGTLENYVEEEEVEEEGEREEEEGEEEDGEEEDGEEEDGEEDEEEEEGEEDEGEQEEGEEEGEDEEEVDEEQVDEVEEEDEEDQEGKKTVDLEGSPATTETGRREEAQEAVIEEKIKNCDRQRSRSEKNSNGETEEEGKLSDTKSFEDSFYF